MRRLLFLSALIVTGCQRPPSPVFVDLDSLAPTTAPVQPSARFPSAALSGLPSASGKLSALEGARHAMGDTEDRIQEARRLIEENRLQALRGLTRALYRSYARAIEAERTLKEQDLEAIGEALWEDAFQAISSLLHQHAQERLPLQNVLALLVGFPYTDPALRPRPENRHDARRHDEAVRAWQELLQKDREFAAAAQRIVDSVYEHLNAQRVEIQVDLSKALNQAAERSQSEALSALQSRLPDFTGTLSQVPDLVLPPVGEQSVFLPSAAPPPIPREGPPTRTLDLTREFLEHELAIWLAQNGYVLVSESLMARDRTKEFESWINQRRLGR